MACVSFLARTLSLRWVSDWLQAPIYKTYALEKLLKLPLNSPLIKVKIELAERLLMAAFIALIRPSDRT